MFYFGVLLNLPAWVVFPSSLWDKIYTVHAYAQSDIDKSTVLRVYIVMDDDCAQAAGNDKFSRLISMHMPLIDSWLPVMMHRVSDGVARSTRPWKSFDVDAFFLLLLSSMWLVLLFGTPIDVFRIHSDVPCVMFLGCCGKFTFFQFSLWFRQTAVEVRELGNLYLHLFMKCQSAQSINWSIIILLFVIIIILLLIIVLLVLLCYYNIYYYFRITNNNIFFIKM